MTTGSIHAMQCYVIFIIVIIFLLFCTRHNDFDVYEILSIQWTCVRMESELLATFFSEQSEIYFKRSAPMVGITLSFVEILLD